MTAECIKQIQIMLHQWKWAADTTTDWKKRSYTI